MKYFLGILFGYLVGGLNPSYVLGRIKGVDIRSTGSHNAGASNTMIVIGKGWGVVVMFLDILKASAVVLFCRIVWPECTYLPAAAGSACVLGHMFPCFLHFRGGKGFASLGGLILALDWRLFFVLLLLCILVVLITDYVFVGALFASVAVPLSIGLFRHDWISAACILPTTTGMFFRHRENFVRLSHGEELGFSWLWKKNRYLFVKDRKNSRFQQHR